MLAFLLVMFILGGIIGWALNELMENSRKQDGLRFVANNSHPQALDRARTYDKLGDWVCVNVRGMSYERGLEVCSHEMGHEIFAEICEKNITRCLGVLNETK